MKYAVYIITLLLLTGCSSSIKTYTEQEQKAYENLQNLIASKSFEIIAHTAKPMMTNALTQVLSANLLPPGNTPAHISIMGTSNYLRVTGDTIQAQLPFYGEQFFGSSIGTNQQGITFNDIPEYYTVTLNDVKHSIDMIFKIRDTYRNNERYEISITLYPNNSCTINLQSTSRSSIQFSGDVKAWQKKAVGDR